MFTHKHANTHTIKYTDEDTHKQTNTQMRTLISQATLQTSDISKHCPDNHTNPRDSFPFVETAVYSTVTTTTTTSTTSNKLLQKCGQVDLTQPESAQEQVLPKI